MSMLEFIEDDIILTKGDTGVFDVVIEEVIEEVPTVRPLVNGDKIIFLLKMSRYDEDVDAVITKTITTFEAGVATVVISPSDTATFKPGSRLYYSVKVIFGVEDIGTIAKGTFIVD